MVDRVQPTRQDVSPGKGDERSRNVLIRGDRLAHGRDTGHVRRNVVVGDPRARDHGYPVLQQVLSAADPGHGKVQAATTSALTSAETVPTGAASALLIREADGSLYSAFAQALLG